MKNKKSWKRGRQQFMKNLEKKLKSNIINEKYNRNLDYNGIQVINRNTGASYTIPRIRGISPRVFSN